MADIQFNAAGVPLIAYGKSYLAKTTGIPDVKLKKTAQPKNPDEDKLLVGDVWISDWGASNNFPALADDIINSVGVLNSGLKFTRNFTLGQGIYACRVTDYDESGNEILERANDKSLLTFANSRLVRRFMAKALRDYLKFGCAFVQILMNADGSAIAGINTINAKYCRLSIADPSGIISKCVISGKWPDMPAESQYQICDVLDEYDPYADLQRRRWAKQTAGKAFVYVIRDSWGNGEYYSAPIWWAAYQAGWIDIAKKVPSFLKKAYENQITWKWHIQIPYSFWDKQFPKTEYADIELRKQAIEKYMDDVEANLCGTDNADKPIFTFFEINPQNGRAEEQWIIKPLENKLSNEQNRGKLYRVFNSFFLLCNLVSNCIFDILIVKIKKTLKKKIQQDIADLYKQRFMDESVIIENLPPSGSYREYIRLTSPHFKAIGTWNDDEKENNAFIEFSKHFRSKGIKVPEIYSYKPSERIYLQEDLGNQTLFSFLSEVRETEGFSDKITRIYRKVVRELPKIQIIAGKDLNYDYCYPRKAFDRQSMSWDLNYFKYYFLKLAKISFNEQLLEDDFTSFTDYLLKAESNFFMFRDFQSRNIMLLDNEPWFIDYQGGRHGALQYDLASLLYDSKANIPQEIREELIDDYLDEVEKIHPVDRSEFLQYFYGYVLIRMMQAMGAYGFRGFYEKKEHFLKSIPFALENLEVVLGKLALPVQLPELVKVLKSLRESEILKKVALKQAQLTIAITSFSFKKGYPADHSGNGGGFVFDCRSVRNPGKYDQYKSLTGKDEAVIRFFEVDSDMEEYLKPVFSIVERSVVKYIERGFTNLSVSFGCTGGQHRSVYSAERMAAYLKNKYPVRIVIHHREQDN